MSSFVHSRSLLFSSLAFGLILPMPLYISGCSRSEPVGPAGLDKAVKSQEAARAAKTVQTAKAAEPLQGDEQAQQLVKRVADFYKAAKTGQVAVELAMELKGKQVHESIASQCSLTFARPNQFRLTTTGDMTSMELVSDGTKLVTYLPLLNAYTEQPAPVHWQRVLAQAAAATGSGMFLMNLLVDDPYRAMTAGVNAVNYIGQEKLDDTSVHLVAFQQARFDVQVWIDAGEKPIVHKISADMTRAIRAAAKAGVLPLQGQDATMTMVERYRNWTLNEKLPADTFVFQPPQGAKKTDDFSAEFRRLMAQQREKSPLLGLPPPAFELTTLDGCPLRLTDLAGKVVVLDFWATWCSPCLDELPQLAELAKQYAEKGVAFYAINVAEKKEVVEKFLQGNKIELPIALDPDGNTMKAFKVIVLPSVFIIGKDGTVQAAQQGYRADVSQVVAEKIDALLAGKTLVAKPAEKEPAGAATGPAGSQKPAPQAKPAPAAQPVRAAGKAPTLKPPATQPGEPQSKPTPKPAAPAAEKPTQRFATNKHVAHPSTLAVAVREALSAPRQGLRTGFCRLSLLLPPSPYLWPKPQSTSFGSRNPWLVRLARCAPAGHAVRGIHHC